MTEATESTEEGGEARALPGWIAWTAGLASLAGGLHLLRLERLDVSGVSGGILLLVAALGFLSVAVGQGRYGPETEGRLDLSARLGVGLLGGTLGGLAYLAVAGISQTAGIPGLLGVGLQESLGLGAAVSQAASGAAWGVIFGLVYPCLPASGPVGRGLLFSLLPALFVLVAVFPDDRKYGLFGTELGGLTFVVVVAYHLAWGAAAGATMAWAAGTEHGLVSRPLGA